MYIPVSKLLVSLLQLPFHIQNNVDSLDVVSEVFNTTGIVPDILPSFLPKTLLRVIYDNSTVVPGQFLSQNTTSKPPSFAAQPYFTGNDTDFVILMIDPDAPSPPNRTWADVRHFLCGSYSYVGDSDPLGFQQLVNKTPAISEYLPPSPPNGSVPHRYILLLYEQPKGFKKQKVVDEDTPRRRWNTTEFEHKANLSAPIGGSIFFVAAEE